MKPHARKSAILLLAVAACGGTGAFGPATSGGPATSPGPGVTQSSGPGGGGGPTPTPQPPPPSGGGGGVPQIPPPPTIDGPSWFINNASAVAGTPPTPDVNFSALQNTVQGPISVGATRTAVIMVYNTSKKTPLVISAITVEGPAASDFSVSQASLNAALNVSIPPNKSAAVSLQVSFTPTVEGVRTAALRLVSNVGTALVSLTGEAFPDRPIIAINVGASLAFFADSAFDTVQVTNQGGQPLVLPSIGLGGASPASFQFFTANRGFSNCFAGIALSPRSSCYLGVGPAAGAAAPSSALLVILSNDPAKPEIDIQLDVILPPPPPPPPPPPVIATNSGPSLTFLPDSAFDTIQVTNQGVQALVLQSIALAGASPASFGFFSANRGFSNCFNGIPLSPNGNCYLGVGPVAGAAVPSSALLVILSNDPVTPELDIQLDLTPPPPPPPPP